jgi:hypothetical protein
MATASPTVSKLTSRPLRGPAEEEHLVVGRLGAGAARGSEKKSPPPPSFTCPSLPRTTLLGFGASSSMIWLNANLLDALPAAGMSTC